MTPVHQFDTLFQRLPLVAILRGLTPAEAPAIGDALTSAGFGLLEVPLNSPDPLQSITTLAQRFPQALVGAGTVLTVQQVRDVHAAGGRLIVSPNTNPAVIREAVAIGMVCLPGFATPSEAFAALEAGAHALKLFPAEAATPAVARALLAVLPRGQRLLPVGGISPQNMGSWRDAGATGFGIGSALYRPGKTAEAVGRDAVAFAAAWQGLLSA